MQSNLTPLHQSLDLHGIANVLAKSASDFPSLNVTAAWWDNAWHVTVGARPLRAILLRGEACGLAGEQPTEDELRALAVSVRALSYGSNLWGSAEYRRRISAPLAIQAVRRAAGIELSAALARELETVQIPKFATDEYSCRRVPGVDSSEVR